MYRQIQTSKIVYTEDGEFIPVASLSDLNGGRCEIVKDGDYFVVYLLDDDGMYYKTPYILPEIIYALKTLPKIITNNFHSNITNVFSSTAQSTQTLQKWAVDIVEKESKKRKRDFSSSKKINQNLLDNPKKHDIMDHDE